jgi:hypothetical protein
MPKEWDVTSLEKLQELAHDDPRAIIEAAFMVINKQKQIVPFLFNKTQNDFYDERTIRDDLLKPGQIGMSTMILAILTVKFLLVPNAWCVCISHEAEATKRLFEKVDFFLNHLPEWLKPFYRPETDNKRNMVNGVMKSRFYIGTAGALAFGRGDTIHYAHLSEVSRWPNSGTIATGIIRAVPVDDPHTWVVKETTANGIGNFHQTEYQRAKDGQSEFTAHFFPWFDHNEYQIKDAQIKDYDDDELALIRRFPDKITDAKLAWRRKMIGSLNSEKGFSPEEMFKQEFPADDKEAFLFSGNPVFPAEKLALYRERSRAPIWTGNLEGIAPHERLDETPRGYMKIWEMPEMDNQYIIFGDVGQFTDFCSAHVLNRKTWKLAATFHARMKASQFGTELNKLGYFYNKSMIAPEANNMGQSTVDRLVELDYPVIYKRQRHNKEEKTVTDEYGWWTDAKTKPLIIGYMQDLIRLEQADIPDIDTIDEMVTYIRNENGSMGASEGNHDDRVISLMGAYYVLKLNPYSVSKRVSSRATDQAKRYREFRKQRTATGKRGGRWR